MKYTTKDINELLVNSGIEKQEKEYQEKVNRVVDDIIESGKKLILLCGPSGAGKTTSALKLEEEIQNRGIEVHHIAMDDYFYTLSKEEKVLMDEGELNVEEPRRVNAPLLESQLKALLANEEVYEYHFDFVSSTCIKEENKMQMHEGDIIVLEGIHAFNPDVISLDLDAYKLFVYPSDIIEHEGVEISDKQIRLTRRFIRNSLYRGHSIEDTCAIFKFLSECEDLYIFPYQKFADQIMNTFIPYELQVYKALLFDTLIQYKDNKDVCNIVCIMKELDSIPIDKVKRTSLIREFIGDSEYSY